MNDEILQAMASDMNIHKYRSETHIQYVNRILYSAVACWIKAAALDHAVTNDAALEEGVSRKHVTVKCTRLLEEMLQRNRINKEWFYPDANSESPIVIIRNRLLSHFDLLNCGFGTNITLASESYEHFGDNLECVRGCILSKAYSYSGLAMIREYPSPGCEAHALSTETAIEWFSRFIGEAWWEPFTVVAQDLQYYNAFKRVKNNHLCWQSDTPNPVGNCMLARRLVSTGAYEYLLVNTHTNKLHRIDPYLQDIGEHRRIMIAMRVIAKNKLPATATCYDDHVHLKLRFHLPDKESKFFEYYAWPMSSILDQLEWIMPTKVWMIARLFLNNLGIEITEVTNG